MGVSAATERTAAPTLCCCSGRLLQVAAATPLGEVALRCLGS